MISNNVNVEWKRKIKPKKQKKTCRLKGKKLSPGKLRKKREKKCKKKYKEKKTMTNVMNEKKENDRATQLSVVDKNT